MLSALSSYLTRDKEIKDPENPEDRTETDAAEVTFISIDIEYEKMSEYSQHYGIVSHCVWISVISVFPLIYCGLFFAIKNTITMDQGNTQLVLPDIVRVNISGPAAELYPNVSGEYKLLPDITVRDRPVYRHTGQDSVYTKDYYIYSFGRRVKLWIIAYQSPGEFGNNFGILFRSAKTKNEDRSNRALTSNLTLQVYLGYPNCTTVR